MTFGKIFGIVLIIIGAVLLYVSHYINEQVAAGRGEISSAQGQLDSAEKKFSMLPSNPVIQIIGEQKISEAQGKINAGTREADLYAQYADWAKIGGIIAIVLGIGVFFISCRKKA